jgi:hypothetical protein
MKMFRILLLNIDGKCHNCRVRQNRQIIHSIEEMDEPTKKDNTKPSSMIVKNPDSIKTLTKI